tara:strand:- start:100 stop:315 length:216 start_codon:yes stop_codon:yes gene_type:complete
MAVEAVELLELKQEMEASEKLFLQINNDVLNEEIEEVTDRSMQALEAHLLIVDGIVSAKHSMKMFHNVTQR